MKRLCLAVAVLLLGTIAQNAFANLPPGCWQCKCDKSGACVCIQLGDNDC